MRARISAIIAVFVLFSGILLALPAQAATDSTIFGSTTPSVPSDADRVQVELGVQFKGTVEGQVNGIRFFKGGGNTGRHVGYLYDGSTVLASATFANETAGGWQAVRFAAPIKIVVGKLYTASYLAPNGHYSVTDPYGFPKSTGSLTALKGVYKYGGGLPRDSYRASNYFVDVLFTPTSKTTAATTSRPSTATSSTTLPPTTSAASPAATPSATTPTPSSVSTSTRTLATITTTAPNTSMPGAANTGVPAGTTLTPSGPLVLTSAGQVIDGLDISGTVVVRASGVVIKNSRIRGSGSYGVQVLSGSVTLYDSEVIGFDNGIGFSNWNAYRVDINGQADDGVKLGSNVTLQDSWIHDLKPSPGAHADGAQLQSGEKNVTVRHNNIDLGTSPNANAALFLAPDLGPSSAGPLVIDGNRLNGGNYTVFCVDGNNGQYFISNISIVNNRFGRASQYGPARINVPVTQSGNVWDDTGASLAL